MSKKFVITPKALHGDTRYYVHDDEVMQGQVMRIAAIIDEDEGCYSYTGYYYMGPNKTPIREDAIFETEPEAQEFLTKLNNAA